MEGQRNDRLKWMLDHVPSGHVIDTPTLERHGVSRKLAHKYVRSGWLEPVMRGLYRRPDPERPRLDDWRVVVRSLQHTMGYGSIVGGRTALEEQGYAHYIALDERAEAHLYADDHPSWLRRLPTDLGLHLHSNRLFRLNGVEGRSWMTTEFTTSAGPLVGFAPERAILELLDRLPDAETFHAVDTIFEGLTTLRPRRLLDCLARCTSIKVKRLFFVFADRHRHAWRRHVDASSVDLGRGDRALVEGGRLHPDYRITIPADLLRSEGGHDGA